MTSGAVILTLQRARFWILAELRFVRTEIRSSYCVARPRASLSKPRASYAEILRIDIIKSQAADYGIFQGSLVSWGFGAAFDEYFGALDEQGRPSGTGVQFYSDGSVYCGEWFEGLRHTAGKGVWTRPDDSQYEGMWVQGLKHGKGK